MDIFIIGGRRQSRRKGVVSFQSGRGIIVVADERRSAMAGQQNFGPIGLPSPSPLSLSSAT